VKIKTFGSVDQRSLEQLERCMKAGDADYGVLCADHHPGYSQPIGGGIAYEGHVSPSGVGYDIGCLATGTRVTTGNRVAVPIEQVRRNDPVQCFDRGATRLAEPHIGAVPRGRKAVVTVRLANGRTVRLTPDHRVWTQRGWCEANDLGTASQVLCIPTVGRARAEYDLPLELIRLVAYVSGDGHLTRDGKRISIYTTVDEDAIDLVRDFHALGLEPHVRRRRRAVTRRPEICIYFGSTAFHRELADLGSPVGRKRWGSRPMRWLFDAPDCVRAHFLSAFASAEMSSPTLIDGRVPNLAVKQADADAARLVVELLASLGFRASLRASADQWVVQILGGDSEQARFIEEVGFCRAFEKRLAAARAASVAWQRSAVLRRREAAQTEVEALNAAGAGYGRIMAEVTSRFNVPRGFVHHSIYDLRPLRRGLHVTFEPRVHGEGVWVEVESIEPAGTADVWDVVTGDPAESFLAEGVVVHNCGNKAARTELTVPDLEARGGVDKIMREITRRISFGMGVPAQERVDHPVLDRIRNADFTPQRKLHQLAESQLGTVGSGNHFVNLFEDEEGKVWIGVHFGSRGFGHKTASGFLALAQGLAFDGRAHEGEMDSPPVLFELDSELGQSYIAAMELAGEYAYAGRDVVVDKVLEILGAEATHEVHNHHNFAWRETHFGRDYWVIRKGCTPARPGQEGFVGGSMGDESVILEGVEGEEATEALDSTVHGAGRVMSRSQAAGRVRRRKRWACRNRDCPRIFETNQPCPDHPEAGVSKVWIEEQVKPGRVDWAAVQERLRKQGIVLVGGGADEAPEVYKRLPDVLAAHAGSVRVKHRLRPLGVAMAGRDVYDPYKD
jgi:tRNA-splicing ligase RtcB (3'-phosphate/5'-hydroxy nucleic acid ligase)